MRSVNPRWMAFPVLAALIACAPQNPPQRLLVGKVQVPAVDQSAAVSGLKFTQDYDGHVCQVGSRSCWTLDSRPFAPCLVSERCNPEGDVVQAAKP